MEFRISSPCRIVVCGDSISAGIVLDESRNRYVKSSEGFVSILQNSLNGAITNISRFGNTVVTALPRLKKDICREKPDIVLIELGGNDCDYRWEQVAEDPAGCHLPATDVRLFASNLTGIIESLRKSGIAPVLTSLPPIDADRYFRWISRSGTETAEKIMQWLGSVTRIYWWQEKYNAAVLKVAESTQTVWIDLRSAFLDTPDFRRYLCGDGIHPNKEGHQLISRTISDFLHSRYPALLKPSSPASV